MNSVLGNYINKHIEDLKGNGVTVLVSPSDRTVEISMDFARMGDQDSKWFKVLDATLWVYRRFVSMGYTVFQPQPVGMWLDEMETSVQQNRSRWQRP